jgi:predicted  nucleic acid-binding Zn-ribbon protein
MFFHINLKKISSTAEEPPPVVVTGTPPSEQDKLFLADPPSMLLEVTRLRERVLELEVAQQHESARHKNWPRPEDVQQLQLENEQMRRHLEKIGKMSTSSGGFNIEALQEDLEKWKEKAKDRRHLQKENEKLLVELSKQADETLVLQQERESLLATIGFLQEELSQSEQMRFRPK